MKIQRNILRDKDRNTTANRYFGLFGIKEKWTVCFETNDTFK